MVENKKFLVLTAQTQIDFEDLEKLLNEGYRIKHADSLECEGASGIVYVLEKKAEDRIVGVKSVDLNEADSWLSQGWEVRDLFARSATLVKKEAKT